MNTKWLKVIVLSAGVITLAGCNKDKDPENDIQPITEGLFVINEGQWGKENGSLSYYDFNSKAVTADMFKAANPAFEEGLGETVQDVHVYGSKMYIVINGSNTIEVINKKTAKHIAEIKLPNSSPRYAASAQGKLFVSAYDDKVYVIDTLSYAVQKSIPVGKDPDQMVVIANKLYVANSGSYESPIFDNTISVIDLTSLQETNKFTVAINMSKIKADKYGDLYVISKGHSWGNPAIPSSLYVVNSTTGAIKKKFDFEATDLVVKDDLAYMYSYSYITGNAEYRVLNVKDETVISSSFISDGSDDLISVPYAIGLDPVAGDIYISDAKDYQNPGTVYCFDKDGKKKFSFTAGVSPTGFAFLVK